MLAALGQAVLGLQSLAGAAGCRANRSRVGLGPNGTRRRRCRFKARAFAPLASSMVVGRAGRLKGLSWPAAA
eukprot:4896907-Alexandrium_andersonii.AAC.1